MNAFKSSQLKLGVVQTKFHLPHSHQSSAAYNNKTHFNFNTFICASAKIAKLKTTKNFLLKKLLISKFFFKADGAGRSLGENAKIVFEN